MIDYNFFMVSKLFLFFMCNDYLTHTYIYIYIFRNIKDVLAISHSNYNHLRFKRQLLNRLTASKVRKVH